MKRNKKTIGMVVGGGGFYIDPLMVVHLIWINNYIAEADS